MTTVQEEIVSTKAFFHNLQIPLSNEWLESCINWFKEEQDGAPYTEKQLHSVVYNQWLVFDLREVELPQLPPNVQSVTKLVLNKNLALQVMTIVDISKPKLQQINKIKNANPLTRGFDDEAPNNYSNVTPKRMLQLTLSDGVQEIKAIEYKPIPSLNLNLTPGIKIKIMGPVTIRRGTIMLESHHIKLLGGEIEEILVSNAAENVLARALNLPENPNPRTVNDSVIETKVENLENVETNPINQKQSKVSVQSNISEYLCNKKESKNIFGNDEDELRIAQEIDDLLETERELLTLPRKTVPTVSKKPTPNQRFFEDEEEELRVSQEIDMLLEAERDLEQQTSQKTKLSITQHNTNHTKIRNTEIPPYDSDTVIEYKRTLLPSDVIEDDLLNMLGMDDKPNENIILTLREVKERIGNKQPGLYTTFAKFKSVERKLTVNNQGWDFHISIQADDEDMVVKMHNTVVTELVGYTPEEVTSMKGEIQKKNAETATLIMEALSGLRLKLIELNCLMEIEYKSGDSVPCIVRFL